MTPCRGPDPVELSLPCPRDRADELAAVRSWLRRSPVRLERADGIVAEPVDGGAALHVLLERLRGNDRQRLTRP